MPLPCQAASRSQKSLSGGAGCFTLSVARSILKGCITNWNGDFSAPHRAQRLTASGTLDRARCGIWASRCAGPQRQTAQSKKLGFEESVHFKAAAQSSMFVGQPIPHRKKKSSIFYICTLTLDQSSWITKISGLNSYRSIWKSTTFQSKCDRTRHSLPESGDKHGTGMKLLTHFEF